MRYVVIRIGRYTGTELEVMSCVDKSVAITVMEAYTQANNRAFDYIVRCI